MTLFSDSFAALLGAIVYKQKLLESDGAERVRLALGASQPHYDAAIATLAKADFLNRLWAHDASLWSNDPGDAGDHQEIARMAFDSAAHARSRCPSCASFGDEVKEKFDFAVVCGMGGSSLAPDILADTFGQFVRTPRAAGARLDLPAADPRARRADPPPRHALRHLEQERHDHRAECVLRLLSRKGFETVGILGGGAKLCRHHRSGNVPSKGSQRVGLPHVFRKRPEHRRTLFGPLVRWNRSVGGRPGTTSTCCSTARSARCTPTIERST